MTFMNSGSWTDKFFSALRLWRGDKCYYQCCCRCLGFFREF